MDHTVTLTSIVEIGLDVGVVSGDTCPRHACSQDQAKQR